MQHLSNEHQATWRRMKGKLFMMVMVAALVSAGALRDARAADGALDSAFGNGGKVVTDFPGNGDYARGIAIQPNGKIIVAGQSGVYPLFHSALVRYNSDGSLDETFGYGGRVVASLDAGGDQLTAIALQPDGKIVAAGSLIHDNFTMAFLLARFNSDGSLDTTFGNNGSVVTNFNSGTRAEGNALVLQPDGKIIVAGVSGTGYDIGLNDYALARYNSNGSLDQSFGNGGKLLTHFIGGYNTGSKATAAVLQPDGRILVAGIYQNDHGTTKDFALARYNSDGTLDATFGSDGKLSTSMGSADALAFGIALQPNGRIVLVGYFHTGHHNNDFALARYNADGSLDTTFGNGGRVINDLFGASDEIAYDVALQADGKLIVTGRTGQYPNFTFAVARYNTNGSFDQSFGNAGKVMTSFGNISSQSYATVIQPDGKIVVGGYNISADTDFALARYLATSTRDNPPADFDGDGKTDFAVFRPGNGFWYILRSSGGTTFTQFGTSNDIPVPEDFDGDNRADIAVWRDSVGTFYVLRSSNNTLQTQQWGQSGDDPTVTRDFDGDGRADFAVYRRGASGGNASFWFILQSSDGAFRAMQWGVGTDLPAPGDYDGDGKADLSVKRTGATLSEPAFFYTLQSANGSFNARQWGVGSDRTAPADYDGDGRTDFAVWRPSDGTFYINASGNGGLISQAWGQLIDRIVPGDYDGDGKADFAVWRLSDGTFYVRSSAGNIILQQWGATGDIPVAFYQAH